MADEFSGDFDLFGDKIYRSDGKRGRPAHEWNLKNSNKVKMLLAVGWSNPRIANALHCSLPTLRKHYFSELKYRSVMRDRFEARQFELVFAAAEAGSVAAMKELSRMVDRFDLMKVERTFNDMIEKEPDAAPPPAGKKEIASLEAETAGQGSEWGDDLLPSMPSAKLN